jgi:plastocyanin
MPLRRLLDVLALLAAAISVAAAPVHHPAGHAAKTWTIAIAQMRFAAAPQGLRVGDTVQWVNQDIFLHSATASDHSFDVNIPVHGSGQLKLTRAGSFAYTCRYHPGMKGELVVAK